jgi:hypothetical protein
MLSELGGHKKLSFNSDRAVTVIEGEQWQAELEPEDTVSFSRTMVIPRSFITFSGEADIVSEIVAAFRRKAFRGGG